MNQQTVEEGKKFAIVAYLTIIGTLFAFYLTQDKKNAFTAFHVRQALGTWLMFFALSTIAGGFDDWQITIGFYIFFSVLFFFGILGAATGKLHKLPLVGDLFQKIFKSLN